MAIMIFKVLISLSIIILWMLGGQINKAFRRYLVPSLIGTWVALRKRKLSPILLIPALILILCTGYGEKSILMKVLKKGISHSIIYMAYIGGWDENRRAV